MPVGTGMVGLLVGLMCSSNAQERFTGDGRSWKMPEIISWVIAVGFVIVVLGAYCLGCWEMKKLMMKKFAEELMRRRSND